MSSYRERKRVHVRGQAGQVASLQLLHEQPQKENPGPQDEDASLQADLAELSLRELYEVHKDASALLSGEMPIEQIPQPAAPAWWWALIIAHIDKAIAEKKIAFIRSSPWDQRQANGPSEQQQSDEGEDREAG